MTEFSIRLKKVQSMKAAETEEIYKKNDASNKAELQAAVEPETKTVMTEFKERKEVEDLVNSLDVDE